MPKGYDKRAKRKPADGQPAPLVVPAPLVPKSETPRPTHRYWRLPQRRNAPMKPTFTHVHPFTMAKTRWGVTDEYGTPALAQEIGKETPVRRQYKRISEHESEDTAREAGRLHAYSVGSLLYMHDKPLPPEVA